MDTNLKWFFIQAGSGLWMIWFGLLFERFAVWQFIVDALVLIGGIAFMLSSIWLVRHGNDLLREHKRRFGGW